MKYLLLSLLFAGFTFCFANAQCPPSKTAGVHVVQKGETLYRISKKYKVTVDQLRQWNSLPSDAISVCQELKVTGAPPATATGPATSTPVYPKQSGPTHIVQRGETIASIARLYGFTEQRFRAFNNLKPGQEVSQGTVLKSDDCQCPELTRPASEPLVAYEKDQPATGPTSMFGDPQRIAPPAETPKPATQPDTRIQPGAPETGYTPAEDLLVNRKDAARPGAGQTAATPVVSAAFKSVVAPYMTAEERSMTDEINLVRSNPAGYIPVIENYKQESGLTSAAVAACDELIAELRNMQPLNVLEPAECLYNAAKKHGADQQLTGVPSHKGSDGSWPWDRVKQACQGMKDGNEILVGGPADVRRDIVVLLVDADLSSRGQRRILLNKDWKYITSYKAGQIGPTPNNWVVKFGK